MTNSMVSLRMTFQKSKSFNKTTSCSIWTVKTYNVGVGDFEIFRFIDTDRVGTPLFLFFRYAQFN